MIGGLSNEDNEQHYQQDGKENRQKYGQKRAVWLAA